MKNEILTIVLIVFSLIASVQAEEKTTIAVLELEPKGVQSSQASIISDRVREELFKTDKYIVTERTRMQDILKEWGFQQAICNESQCIIQAGNILGVQQMVAGSVQKMGNLYSISVRIVDVKTGKILAMTTSDCNQCSIEDFALRSARDVVAKLTGIPFSEGLKDTTAKTISGAKAGEKVNGPISGMEFVHVPGGSYMMGSRSGVGWAGLETEPLHRVDISPFYIMNTEVTQAQWKSVMSSTVKDMMHKSNTSEGLAGVGDNYPMYNVSWHDIHYYIDKLNELDPGKGYRLPTEAEWEYACRAGTTTWHYLGDSQGDLEIIAWYEANSRFKSNVLGYSKEGCKTHPVAIKEPNAWGLYDMLGNVSEWCEDCYQDGFNGYKGAPNDGSAWVVPVRWSRVVRGGSFLAFPIGGHSSANRYVMGCASNSRGSCEPDRRSVDIGFRLVRSK